MNNDLFERVLIQLQPELAQEFGCAILEDRKKLQALEIIKEKEVHIFKIKICDSLDEYNKLKSSGRELTQEEYDLLRGVLL